MGVPGLSTRAPGTAKTRINAGSSLESVVAYIRDRDFTSTSSTLGVLLAYAACRIALRAPRRHSSHAANTRRMLPTLAYVLATLPRVLITLIGMPFDTPWVQITLNGTRTGLKPSAVDTHGVRVRTQ